MGNSGAIDFSQYQALSFDCYGTLIDWERGILAALKPVLAGHNISLSDNQILVLHSEFEPRAQSGDYVSYREVLGRVMTGIGQRLGFMPSVAERDCLADSLKDWLPFPDTTDALRRLEERFRLAIISNVDDDLFAPTGERLKVAFDAVVTSQQAGSYKPCQRNFELGIRRIGLPRENILHVAQSLYHDIVPARAMGLTTVWVNRVSLRVGLGATRPEIGQPDLEVPDLETLASLVSQS